MQVSVKFNRISTSVMLSFYLFIARRLFSQICECSCTFRKFRNAKIYRSIVNEV